jgi:hypothetical protein
MWQVNFVHYSLAMRRCVFFSTCETRVRRFFMGFFLFEDEEFNFKKEKGKKENYYLLRSLIDG